jgi:hypothetical protein
MEARMKRDELLKVLRDLKDCEDKDREAAHVTSDQSLLDYLADPEITEAYNAITKWYA